ncbi:MAG TPA: hypothetical protein DHV03_06755 [Alphaproteobacteria bacterium]|nr:hypothetical protein [Alphaproteobacteria bacterium]
MTSRAWQRMLSGRRLDILQPSPLDIEIEDIAHGLARVSRWNGQTSGPFSFSVADHSLLVEAIFSRDNPGVAPGHQLAALLHDAPEFVIGDLISPFKNAIKGEYRMIEDHLLQAIHQRFGLSAMPAGIHHAIKKADGHAAYMEAVALAGFDVAEATQIFSKPDKLMDIPAVRAPMDAKKAFLKRFNKLYEDHQHMIA